MIEVGRQPSECESLVNWLDKDRTSRKTVDMLWHLPVATVDNFFSMPWHRFPFPIAVGISRILPTPA
jgi:hypothetical protein